MAWKLALQRVLEVSYEPLQREEVQWTVLGSVATALQGCQISPGDLDLLFVQPAGVHHFAQLMSVFAVPKRPPAGALWFSSREEPVQFEPPNPRKEIWHFGRWRVAGFKVEAAHIAPPEDQPAHAEEGGIWEAGPKIWPHIRLVSFGRYPVPVVPLEIQLETNLNRGLKDRVEEIATVLQSQGYDPALMQQSPSRRNRETFAALLGGE